MIANIPNLPPSTPVIGLPGPRQNDSWTARTPQGEINIDRRASRWRLTNRDHNLWEDDALDNCFAIAEHVAAEANLFAAWRAGEIVRLQRPSHINGVSLAISKDPDRPFGYAKAYRKGKEVGSVGFSYSPWQAAFVLRQPTVNCGSRLDESVRGRGIGRALYDMVEEVVGLPVVPHGRNGVDGHQSEDAKRFWAKRSAHRPVPGFNDPEADSRMGLLRGATSYFDIESGHDCGVPFALAVAERTGWPLMVEENGYKPYAYCVKPDGMAFSSFGPCQPNRILIGLDASPIEREALDKSLRRDCAKLSEESKEAAIYYDKMVMAETAEDIYDRKMTAAHTAAELILRRYGVLTATLDSVCSRLRARRVSPSAERSASPDFSTTP